jgi:hypothetical protein
MVTTTTLPGETFEPAGGVVVFVRRLSLPLKAPLQELSRLAGAACRAGFPNASQDEAEIISVSATTARAARCRIDAHRASVRKALGGSRSLRPTLVTDVLLLGTARPGTAPVWPRSYRTLTAPPTGPLIRSPYERRTLNRPPLALAVITAR